jgi:predicted TIM-barrel fold metal-dependent hydrolase
MDVRDAFRRAIDVLGAHRLLFGTDSSFFPRGWLRARADEHADRLFEIGVSQVDAELILGANLRRLLGRG